MENDLIKARLLYYSFFKTLFLYEELSLEPKDDFKDLVLILKDSPFDENLKESLERVSLEIYENGFVNILSEYQKLFFEPNGASLGFTASFYNEGYEAGTMLVRTKDILNQSLIRKDSEKFPDNEDHFGFLFTMMGHFLEIELDSNEQSCKYKELSKSLFSEVINGTVEPFIEAIVNSVDSRLYKDIATILFGFINFERFFYDIKATEVKNTLKAESINEKYYKKRKKQKQK